MAKIKVNFEYVLGIDREIFRNIRLTGSWNAEGRYSEEWRTVEMSPLTDSYGYASSAVIELEDTEIGKQFFWSVLVDAPWGADLPGIMTESTDPEHPGQLRSFTLQEGGSLERYRVTPTRSLGANKRSADGQGGISFSVWAPHARKVETVIAVDGAGGYIHDDGTGAGESFDMLRDAWGVWSTSAAEPALADYERWKNRNYMFRITREDGSVVYRTDLFSRSQAGYGGRNPADPPESSDTAKTPDAPGGKSPQSLPDGKNGGWNGKASDLESTKSCSVVKNPEEVWAEFTMPGEPAASGGGNDGADSDAVVSSEDFWLDEYDPLFPVPSKAEDLVIYELHVAGLGAGKEGPGTLADAMNMLDYLTELGVNAVELLPMSGFDGVAGWGYGSSHFYSIKYEPEGRDQFKHFVRACHKRGIAVLVDVVYNHYSPDNERCQWMYDSTRHDHNSFYYYQGKQEDYGDFPEGGYCDNMSTGYLPNVAEETVRKLMIGSAVNMALEYHVDGFRMDLTQALHSFNVLHKDGSPAPEANEAGIRFMREWARTLRFFRPSVILLAEDHSGWNMVDRSEITSGIGFDAIWWSEWYHQLIGDSDQDSAKAHLLREAGFGTDKPLAMDTFGKMVLGAPGKVVYHESHDESGNSANSARNIRVAVNDMLVDDTRQWAEARCRVTAGLTLLSAGTPMFFMGEEVCASEPYRYSDFLEHREDYQALREGSGAGMFAYYRDVIRLRLDKAALRSPLVEVIKVHDQDRVIAYRRWWNNDEFLVVATFKDSGFPDGYEIAHESLKGKIWYELFNSDRQDYGGSSLENEEDLSSESGALNLKIPPCSITVLARKN